MQKNHVITISVSIMVVFLVVQASMIYFVMYQTNRTMNSVNQSVSDLTDKIDSNKRETQANFNSLAVIISNISAVQSSLQNEVATVKANSNSDFSDIISREIEGVVTIKTDLAQGTGFFISSDGYIVTNYHVIEGARAAGAFTHDGTNHQVTLVGYDANIDVALLKTSGSFTRLSFGDSDSVKVGQKVLAIGNPLGLSFTATQGIISAIDRPGINDLPYYFQTDVPLNPGNSGGPLIDTSGNVVGINNFKAQGADSIGFALESNRAKDAVNGIAMADLNMTLV